MSDIINNPSQSVSIQERVRLAVEAKAKLDEQIAENNRLLEDLRLEMQEAINSDLAHYNFWEWKVSNDDSNYNFYHEL